MFWLVLWTARRAPHRLLLAALSVAFPVAALAATLFYVDDASQAMTRVALRPVQVEMRALATSLDADPARFGERLRAVPGVQSVDVFAAADVVVSAPGVQGRVTARLFAVEPAYFDHHPWVRPAGDLRRGALLNDAVAQAPGFATASNVRIDLRGDVPPLGLTLPVAGRADVRGASAWFEIPAGDVQGDVAVVPRAIVVDFGTFRRAVLPALRKNLGGATAVTNPGLSELPPVSLEAHVAVAHDAYPPDPGRAVAWSGTLRRTLERRAPGEVIVADNAAEPLTEAGVDAVNAKILFVLLGVPGVLVAAALGLAAAAALAEAHRRDEALLRLRGATDAQLVRLAVGQGAVAGIAGIVLGLGVAGLAVSAVIGHPVWRDVPASRLAVTVIVSVLGGTVATAARLVALVRAGRRQALLGQRRQLAVARPPAWRRARLDVVAPIVGLAILGVNLMAGGLRPTPVEGQAVALSFYVLLAPLALWAGTVLLLVRGLLALLARWSRPDRSRPLSSWPAAALRWLGRRPARTAAALTLGALAVAFGTEAVTFAATYGTATRADARAAFGADLRLVPATDRVEPLPDLGRGLVTTPIRSIPARAGSDRKTVMAIDPSYRAAAIMPPQIVRGGGLDALARDRSGVLVAQEVAQGFGVRPGDIMPVTVFPDDLDLSQKLELHVVGVFRAFPPTEPFAEMVVNTAVIPAPVPAPDLYLAKVRGGEDPGRVATRLRADGRLHAFTVTTVGDRLRQGQRGLTALNLDGLSRIEAAAAGLIAAVGVGVLGAFLVVERRREFTVLRTLGADTPRTFTGPLVEGAVTVLGSLAVGVPVGLGLGILAVRVLGLFFALPPPLVTLPVGEIAAMAGLVIVVSGVALAVVLRRVDRLEVTTLLREP